MVRREIADGPRSVPRRLEQRLDVVHELVKPVFRGRLHAGLFPIAIVLGTVLVLFAPNGRTRLARGVFAVTTAVPLGISALYHRGHWGEHTGGVLQRIDHANIFVIIAGSYTP